MIDTSVQMPHNKPVKPKPNRYALWFPSLRSGSAYFKR